jgi:hypothetical protein
MKTKSIFLAVALCLSATSAMAADKFTIVTENIVDVNNLFTHPDLKQVRPGEFGVPENIAHVYTLRATYTIVTKESSAVITTIPAGCDGMDGAVSCWKDHLEGRLDLNSAGNTARWELIDQTSGKTLFTRSAQLQLDSAFLATNDLSEVINFSGTQYMGVPRLSIADSGREYFLDQEKKYSLFFSEMYLDDLYRGGRFVLESRGNNRYALVGIQYGGQTNTGYVIPVVQGAEFPNAGVWLTKNGDNKHLHLVGEPRSETAFTHIKVVSVIN